MPAQINPRRVITVDDGGTVVRYPTPVRRPTTGGATRQQNSTSGSTSTGNLGTRGNSISLSEAVRAVQYPESNSPETRAYYTMKQTERETVSIVQAAGKTKDFLFFSKSDLRDENESDLGKQARGLARMVVHSIRQDPSQDVDDCISRCELWANTRRTSGIGYSECVQSCQVQSDPVWVNPFQPLTPDERQWQAEYRRTVDTADTISSTSTFLGYAAAGAYALSLVFPPAAAVGSLFSYMSVSSGLLASTTYLAANEVGEALEDALVAGMGIGSSFIKPPPSLETPINAFLNAAGAALSQIFDIETEVYQVPQTIPIVVEGEDDPLPAQLNRLQEANRQFRYYMQSLSCAEDLYLAGNALSRGETPPFLECINTSNFTVDDYYYYGGVIMSTANVYRLQAEHAYDEINW